MKDLPEFARIAWASVPRLEDIVRIEDIERGRDLLVAELTRRFKLDDPDQVAECVRMAYDDGFEARYAFRLRGFDFDLVGGLAAGLWSITALEHVAFGWPDGELLTLADLGRYNENYEAMRGLDALERTAYAEDQDRASLEAREAEAGIRTRKLARDALTAALLNYGWRTGEYAFREGGSSHWGRRPTGESGKTWRPSFPVTFECAPGLELIGQIDENDDDSWTVDVGKGSERLAPHRDDAYPTPELVRRLHALLSRKP